MFLCRKNLLYSTEVLLDIYREYVQQMQDYRNYLYKQSDKIRIYFINLDLIIYCHKTLHEHINP